MILYLRIVHSFDYYTAVEYPNEDEMPHRCGIMHARAPPPKAICENEGRQSLLGVLGSVQLLQLVGSTC